MKIYYPESIKQSEEELSKLIGQISTPLNSAEDLNPLMNYIGDAKYVLLGEASHGTHEYYSWRMKITKRLIQEKGFNFIAVEGDWPDCYKMNRFVKGYPESGKNSREILNTFNRWPTWMWANWEMVAFMEWMKDFNEGLSLDKKIGFYGLDVYSLYESLNSIIRYLKNEDTETLETAVKAMKCFEKYGSEEGQSYARASAIVPEPCTKEVVDLLSEIRRKMTQYDSDPESVFNAEQNALVALNAEKYYRAMIHGGAKSWNIRDRHMMSTLNRLMNFHGENAKVIVWEHNTHIGDARATDMATEGMVNVGQLATEQHAEDGVVLVGFGSYSGSVMASKEWGAEMEKMPVPPAVSGSWEHTLHLASKGRDRLLMLNKIKDDERLGTHIGHRAIGVVYRPEHEKHGNYVPSILPMRYDAFLFIDETKALHPLHIKTDGNQIPETYPFGF